MFQSFSEFLSAWRVTGSGLTCDVCRENGGASSMGLHGETAIVKFMF